MTAPDGSFGGGTYGSNYYGGGIPPMPRLHIRIVFDADPLVLGGVATGDNSTCESLGAWQAPLYATAPPAQVVTAQTRRSGGFVQTTRSGGAPLTVTPAGRAARSPSATISRRPTRTASLALNSATSRVYAGSHSLQLTANDAGTASALIYGLGTVTAGRAYLMWAHVRPETTARTARIVLLWKSATDVFLGADTAERVEVSTGFVRIGLLATAPPAAARVDIAIDVLDCAAGEVHYLDTVTVDQAGTDISDRVSAWKAILGGRNHELDRTDSGKATITLGNQDGRFTPGRAGAGAPYEGNIVPRRRVFILAEWQGVLHPIWSGYTRRWVASDIRGDQWSAVQLECDDGFRWLSGVDVSPAYRAEVLADAPLSLYCLDEPSASTSAGDVVAGGVAALLISKTGSGQTAFGSASALPVLVSGSNSDGGASALGFNLESGSLADRGAVLDLRFASGMPPQLVLAPWTVEFWVRANAGAPAFTQIVYRHITSAAGGGDSLSGFQIEVIASTGQLRAFTGNGELVATTAGSICNGNGHHVALTYETGGVFGTASLYVDGALVAAKVLTADPFVAGLPNNCQFGGAISTLTATPTLLFVGFGSHVAHYYKRLSAARILAHHQAGAVGGYLETEAERIVAALRFAGWPDEDTRIDHGLTALMPRDWRTTNGLALTQDVATYGGASVVMDARGAYRMLDRHRFVNEVPVVATFRASDGTEAEDDGDFTPWLDDSRIENAVEVARIGGGSATVRNAASVARFGRIKGSAIPLGAATDAESVAHAQWRLGRTAAPRVRVDSITFRPDSGGAALWPLILPREFGERIAISELPSLAPASSLDVIIGRITHGSADNGATWKTVFQLEPAVIDQMGVCDHPVYGIADTALCVAGY